ncbi:MAG: nitric oxide reductase NorE protein [Kiritimatiellia bacterium]|jgi:nitric oxide reductase NorE protein
MVVEVVTFGLFLLHHAWSWAGQIDVYMESQAQLHISSATLGTILLLIGSWSAYQGVLACEKQRGRFGALWLAATTLSGLLFLANKVLEYSYLQGVSLSTNGFWFSYLFLTQLHLLHVLAGVGGFAWLAFRAYRGQTNEGEGLLSVQAGAAYWHLIDVVWLMLFPILYLMHP